MLKLLLVAPCPFPAPRGSQVFIEGTARGLVALGHDVTVATYASAEGILGPGLSVLRARPVWGESTGSGPHWSKPMADAALARAVRRHVQRDPPDAVLAHNVEGPLVARAAGVVAPVIWEAHTRMSEELPAFVPASAPLGALADRAAARASDCAIALSEPGARWLRGMGLRAEVVPPGVDVAQLAGADRSRGRVRFGLDERVWVVYSGNTDPYQELPRLVEAVRRTDSAGLLLVTSGRNRVDVSALPPARVRVAEGVDLEAHADAIAACDLAVVPRSRCAGFPMKVLNYAAVGLPTIATADGVQPIPGTVAVADSPEAIAQAIRVLAAEPEYRRALGRAALAAATTRTWRSRAESLSRVVEDAVRRTARR